MDSLKDLYLLLEEENMTSPAHQTDKKTAADEQQLNPTIKVDGVTRTHTHIHTHAHTSLHVTCFPLQSSAVSSTLADLRVALQDLSGELRQARQGSQELTQQFAKAKASWEVERTELKSLITQVRRVTVNSDGAAVGLTW